ncbi:SH3 domain-containing protein [Chloroflexi bacterium TSY]|nr:SH3 domain-containing protein [Chloroflexi bacterium TSY]
MNLRSYIPVKRDPSEFVQANSSQTHDPQTMSSPNKGKVHHIFLAPTPLIVVLLLTILFVETFSRNIEIRFRSAPLSIFAAPASIVNESRTEATSEETLENTGLAVIAATENIASTSALQVNVNVDVGSAGQGGATANASTSGNAQVIVKASSVNGDGTALAQTSPSGDIQISVDANGSGDLSANASFNGPDNTQVKVETDGPGSAQAEIVADGSPIKAPSNPSTGALDARPFSTQRPPRSVAPGSQTNPTQNNSTQPKAITVGSVVNVSEGPGLTYDIVGQSLLGDAFNVVGTNSDRSWWKVCCVDTKLVWVNNAFVRLEGQTTQVQTASNEIATSQTGSPSSQKNLVEPIKPTPTATPEPSYEFELVEATRFPEDKLPRIFVFASSNDEGLAGYRLIVQKDGLTIPLTGETFPGRPSHTWPLVGARQRFHNMKIEFPKASPAGTWSIQLADTSGQPVGPPAVFKMKPDESNQEMYVHYRRK